MSAKSACSNFAAEIKGKSLPPATLKRNSLVPINRQSSQPTLIPRRPKEG